MNVTLRPPARERGKIVVADDDAATRLILAQILKRQHFDVIAVENGKLACEAVRRETPDLVLLDCMMPIMNGRAALSELKANHQTRSIPIMMLTTQSLVAEKVGALADGAQDYLTKPFDAQELIARIEQHLGWRKLLTGNADTVSAAERSALLDQGEWRYRMLTEAMPHMVWLSDARGHITYCNRAWHAYTGATLRRMQDGGWFALVHPADRTRCARAWATSLATGRAYQIDYRIRRAFDGMHRWHTVHAAPVRDSMDKIVGWVGSCTDIHDTRIAGAETRDMDASAGTRMSAALSAAQYGALIAVMPQLVWMLDGTGHLTFVNERWSAYTGVALPPDVATRGDGVIDGDDLAIINAMRTLDPPAEFECEARIRRADGAYRCHLVHAVPLADDVNGTGQWVMSGTDIEDRKTANLQIATTAAKLTRLAHYDEVSGLPNRVLLMDRLAEAIALARRRAFGVILLYVDLDYFKTINDTWGHVAGDFVLREVGRRLTAALRVGDTAARVGGDEFILVCAAGEHAVDEGAQIAQRVIAAITRPIEFDGHMLAVGASIGVSIYPDDALDADNLIARADKAMYAAKRTGRNGYRVYDADATT